MSAQNNALPDPIAPSTPEVSVDSAPAPSAVSDTVATTQPIDSTDPTQTDVEKSIERSAKANHDRAMKAAQTRKRRFDEAVANGADPATLRAPAKRAKKAKKPAKGSHWMSLVMACLQFLCPKKEGQVPGERSGGLTNSMRFGKVLKEPFMQDKELAEKLKGHVPTTEDAVEWLKKIKFDPEIVKSFLEKLEPGHKITLEDGQKCIKCMSESSKQQTTDSQ